MLKRWKITVEYDGQAYHGWQIQDNVPTIQQAIQEALFKFCQQKINVQCAGRTDAGVHAYGQVAHFDLDYGTREMSAFEITKAINAHLIPQPIAVLKAEIADTEFHARYGAKKKQYMYRAVVRYPRPVQDLGRVWHIKRKKLNLKTMQEAAKHLIGTHDFTSFRDSNCQAKTPIKHIDRFDIETIEYDPYGGTEYRFIIEGPGFLHHQVRNMVGTLSLVGEGKWTAEQVKEALGAKDRAAGGPTAPADGLYLMWVNYD
ncbi:MAG: tRNA pseudouridine(38-40) synthase TruA [Micavibrio sp.]|nr:tRNA pseudouridine(38-40) synthase TruA [Micavibrio sp.]|tara:strand:- start:175 stop:948 length:774 start_codon:yes stop_codon:yes gene_type:complete